MVINIMTRCYMIFFFFFFPFIAIASLGGLSGHKCDYLIVGILELTVWSVDSLNYFIYFLYNPVLTLEGGLGNLNYHMEKVP